MTVAELIVELKKQDPSMRVLFWGYPDCAHEVVGIDGWNDRAVMLDGCRVNPSSLEPVPED